MRIFLKAGNHCTPVAGLRKSTRAARAAARATTFAASIPPSHDEVEQRVRDGIRPMRGQIVPGAFDDVARDEPREPFLAPGRVWRRLAPEPRRAGPQHDRRHVHGRPLGEPSLHVEKPFLARRVELPVPVRVHDDVDEIRVVERRRRAGVGFVRVLPFRRPRVPEITDDVVAIRFERARAGIDPPGVTVFWTE